MTRVIASNPDPKALSFDCDYTSGRFEFNRCDLCNRFQRAPAAKKFERFHVSHTGGNLDIVFPPNDLASRLYPVSILGHLWIHQQAILSRRLRWPHLPQYVAAMNIFRACYRSWNSFSSSQKLFSNAVASVFCTDSQFNFCRLCPSRLERHPKRRSPKQLSSWSGLFVRNIVVAINMVRLNVFGFILSPRFDVFFSNLCVASFEHYFS